MRTTGQFWFLDSRTTRRVRNIFPVCAGCVMLIAGLSPWLVDPLGSTYSAWGLPVDIGWQFHLAVFNYGLLCLACALYAFLVAFAVGRPFKGSVYFSCKHVHAGLCCLVPLALFLLQYLCIDLRGTGDLAQHKVQALLIQQHFGYNTSRERVSIAPLSLDVSTIGGRLVLLIDQLSIGAVLPFISAWLLIGHRHFPTVPVQEVAGRRRRKYLQIAGIFALVIVFGRGPAAMLCEYEARLSMAGGGYTQALGWLRSALTLNPTLDETAFYHLQRGQALYFLRPADQGDDSRMYLASVYRGQKDALDAYQQQLGVWHLHHSAPWVLDEICLTLENLAEFTKSPNGSIMVRPANDDTALLWLQLLLEVNPSSVYGRYMLGRVQYDLHDYSLCIAQMKSVLKLSSNSDIWSSAYTYLALSDAGLGRYVEARDLLFQALALDPDYRNNTAREELSGLH